MEVLSSASDEVKLLIVPKMLEKVTRNLDLSKASGSDWTLVVFLMN